MSSLGLAIPGFRRSDGPKGVIPAEGPLLAGVAILLCLFTPVIWAGSADSNGWVGAWETAPSAGSLARQPVPSIAPLALIHAQTHRQIVRVSVGGHQARITFSNAYGTAPLVIAAASIGRVIDGRVVEDSIRPVTFGGSRSITVAIGAPALSDAVTIDLANGGEAAISLYLPNETQPETYSRALPDADLPGHELAGGKLPASSLSTEGDFTAQAVMPGETLSPRLFVTRVDMLQPRAQGAVVVFGSSSTVGVGRWYDQLATHLNGRLAVVNASMVANPLTRPYPNGGEAGLARFDRDVLLVPRVKYVILDIAINDIAQPGGAVVPASEMSSLDKLQSAYLQIVERAHAVGLKVIVATVFAYGGTPFKGSLADEKEKLRSDLNRWFRTSKVFDGVFDYEATVNNPADPTHFRPELQDPKVARNLNEAGEGMLAAAVVKLLR